ncbi:Glycosyltransferase involved in cell wall bisynthesis [Reichenbachiella agariperforans]|uniref:Glycosyltransferase involved in cell wall bisynthesis n=1 Tax=Reichenbachiella agariperforans TaxID=156994 RepID=A0A1M6W4S8_REIAG|nr:glycosyltransferase [Reichenbachiella agariperforans]SHK88723.1 Glycosyltransferase involved in cell wall bisynthesis [Reichenbachiella agariperforans]
MNILHITTWYPTHKNPKSALWVQRHIEALAQSRCKNTTYHLEVNKGDFQLSLGKREILGNKSYRLISSFLPWFLMEVISIILLSWILWKERNGNYNLINFHIAYPNLTYWHWIKRWVKTPVVITEHWSAYHENFGLADANKLPRIQHIFHQQIPVIAVSHALIQDIKSFSNADFPSYVVPNIVDTTLFFHNPNIKPTPHRFFMISQWKTPKDPFAVIESFAQYVSQFPEARLRIGGYGPQLQEMQNLVKNLSLPPHVDWLGTLDSKDIANEMNAAAAFIHLSNYETFSVVCAEAVCCGCPVIASNIGGIPEFIDNSNGVLIDHKNKLLDSLLTLSNKDWNRKTSATTANKRFSIIPIGIRYLASLSSIIKQ